MSEIEVWFKLPGDIYRLLHGKSLISLYSQERAGLRASERYGIKNEWTKQCGS